jgi:hypothetical protein
MVIGDECEVARDDVCVVIGPVILYTQDAMKLRDWLIEVLTDEPPSV